MLPSRCSPAPGLDQVREGGPLEKTMADQRITTYSAFWPYYLGEHAKPTTRAWHYLGSTLALLCLLALIVTGDWRWILGALVAGYGPAWIGHFFIEKNRPATFKYPFWSLISDYRMYVCFLSGRMDEELRRAGVAPPPKSQDALAR